MSSRKKCTNCGADNDPLITICIYCKSPLASTDINSISDEELILNAGEWIGKVGESYEHITEKFNMWTGKGMVKISANELEGLAQRYLSLLQVRSLNNANLQMAYSDLKTEFDNKRKSFLYRLGGGDKKRGQIIIFMSVPFLFFLLFFFIIGIFM